MTQIAGPQLNVKVVSERIGDASALKMCSGALTKGTQSLWLEVMVAAQRLGVHELLEQDAREGPRAEIYKWVQGQLAITLGQETPEQGRALGCSGAEVVQQLARRGAGRS